MMVSMSDQNLVISEHDQDVGIVTLGIARPLTLCGMGWIHYVEPRMGKVGSMYYFKLN